MPEPVAAPFTALIGGVVKEIHEGSVQLTVVTGPQHCDRWGRVHGGVLTSLMDSVIGIALGRLRAEEAHASHGPHATIGMSTSFYSSAHPGDEIVVEGGVTKLEDRVAFGEVEARRRADGELLARAHLSFAVPGAVRAESR